MDFISRVLFESPFWLGVFCFAGFGVALFWRQRQESPAARRRIIPMTLAAIVLLFVMQYLTVTERERIWSRLDEFVSAIVRENTTAAAALISESYLSEEVDKARFVESLRDWFEVIDVRDPRLTSREVVVQDDHGTMTLKANATVSHRKEAGATHFGEWTIEWRRDAEGWSMTAIRPESIDMQPVRSLRDLRGVVR